VTCFWSRAVSLEICFSADTTEILRATQSHIYKYGLFQRCYSDLGSQMVKGSKMITQMLDSVECNSFFEKHGISKTTFEQYPKGNSSLGSVVEICVKQVKSLIAKAIGRNILGFPEFQLLISKTIHVINRRPVAFKQYLCDSVAMEEIPVCITPEMLIYGRELLTLDIIPNLNVSDDNHNDPDFDTQDRNISLDFEKLQKCNRKLIETYHREFLVALMHQAISERDRYKPVLHKKLGVGDIVLLIEPHLKQYNYPLGIVKSINTNSLGETTSAIVLKGNTCEQVYRHSTSLIQLLSPDDEPRIIPEESQMDETERVQTRKDRRPAALMAENRIKNLFNEE